MIAVNKVKVNVTTLHVVPLVVRICMDSVYVFVQQITIR